MTINFFLLEKPYIHEKLEKKYEEEFLLPKLAEKERLLTEIKDYHQPLTRSALKSHQQSYDNLKKMKENEIKAKRDRSLKGKLSFIYIIEFKEFDNSKFMSKFLRKAIDEDHVKRQSSPLESKLDSRKKIDKYKELIKSLHAPTISKVKAREMRALKGKSYLLTLIIL